jgi:hypothetical protein
MSTQIQYHKVHKASKPIESYQIRLKEYEVLVKISICNIIINDIYIDG